MEFLCVTGVEDKLQDDVLKTIETLRQAGMQIWMLTGDKVETAKTIAISTGLKAKDQQIFEMVGMSEKHDIVKKLKEFEL
jgi:phospholipid-translocating ATPase